MGKTGLSPIDASEICTVVPVKNLANAKQRLSPLLNEQERYRLFRAMLEDVLNVLVKTTMLARVVLVTRDEEVLSLAGKFDVDTLVEPENLGQTEAVNFAVTHLMNHRGPLLADCSRGYPPGDTNRTRGVGQYPRPGTGYYYRSGQR